MIRRVHMVESGGRGGVFNHSVEVAVGLAEIGVDVVLHTAQDHEEIPAGVRACRCVVWHRRSASRLIRQARTSGSYFTRTLPHLLRAIGRDDVVHLQGLFALTPELIAVAKLRQAPVICSPHNTFVRAGAPGGARSLKSVLRGADRVLVYSAADVDRLSALRPKVAQVPLVQWSPPPSPELVRRWRENLNPSKAKLALMAGQVRSDKNPELFVHALASMPGWQGAIVGDDLGPGAEIDKLIARLKAPVTTRYGYLEVADFAALVGAADVIVAPYEVASQSGVLAVAANLGVPTAVAPVGGLTELGTAVARDSSPESLREAIVAASEIGSAPSAVKSAAKLFLEEYLTAVDHRRAPRRQTSW